MSGCAGGARLCRPPGSAAERGRGGGGQPLLPPAARGEREGEGKGRAAAPPLSLPPPGGGAGGGRRRPRAPSSDRGRRRRLAMAARPARRRHEGSWARREGSPAGTPRFSPALKFNRNKGWVCQGELRARAGAGDYASCRAAAHPFPQRRNKAVAKELPNTPRTNTTGCRQRLLKHHYPFLKALGCVSLFGLFLPFPQYFFS